MNNLEHKKIDMAGKMYKQTGTRPGFPSKYTQNGKGGVGKEPKYAPMASPGGKGVAPKPYPQDTGHSGFGGKYKQAHATRNRPMIQGSSKANQKGKASLERAAGPSGLDSHLVLGKNEHNRA